MPYLFTSESVSEGHPDKVADQISDALIDHFLAFDKNSKVACETLVTTGQVVVAGEVKTTTYLDVQKIVRDVIKRIGYTKSEYMFEADGRFALTDEELIKVQTIGMTIPDIEISLIRTYEYERPMNLIPVAIGIGIALLVAFSGKKRKK